MNEDWLAIEIGKVLRRAVGKEVTLFQGLRPPTIHPPCVAWWINNTEPLDTAKMNNVELVVRAWAAPSDSDNDDARGAARQLSRKIEVTLHKWNVQLTDPDRFAYAMLARTSKIVSRDGDETAARGWESAYIIQTDED